MNAPTNYDDLIDSRDVIARIEELADERQTLTDELGDIGEQIEDLDDDASDLVRADLDEERQTAFDALKDWDAENGEELRTLEALAEEAEGYASDWRYGETLIRDSYFETYAQELAEDCGMLANANAWPLTCIDWEQAARELQYDYTSVDFDGVTYWIRSC